VVSEGNGHTGLEHGTPESSGAVAREDFADQPVYQIALRLCGLVLDLESRYPDEEREALYTGMRNAAVETGSLIAAGFGRRPGPARYDRFEQARSRLMEARHYLLVSRLRYVLDSNDVESFDLVYFELLPRLSELIGIEIAEHSLSPGRKC
jgi:four helix bundle protein